MKSAFFMIIVFLAAVLLVLTSCGGTLLQNDGNTAITSSPESLSQQTTQGLPQTSSPQTTEKTVETTAIPEKPYDPLTKVYDISVAQDGSLTARLEENADGVSYTIVIEGAGEMGSMSPLWTGIGLEIPTSKVTALCFPEGLASISEAAFDNMNAIVEVEIPDSVTTIGTAAFAGCDLLAKVKLPSGLKILESDTFSGCESLEVIDLPEGLEKIGYNAFQNCVSLTEIVVPSSVQEMGECIFGGCKALQTLTIPFTGKTRDGYASMTHILGKYADGGVYRYRCPETVILSGGTRVAESAFNSCDVKRIILPDTLEIIEPSAFAGCHYLESIEIPDGITYLPSGAFSGCYRLRSVTLPESLEAIASDAFSSCHSLLSIDLGENLNWLDNAFNDCYRLVEVIYRGSALTSEEIYHSMFSWTNDDVRVIHTGTQSLWETHDGLVYFNGVLVDYVGDQADITVGASTVLSYAFAYNETITSVKLTKGVKSLGEGAFYDCPNLTSVTLECELSSLPEQLFMSCDKLLTVTLPETLSSIGAYVLSGTAYYADLANWTDGGLYYGNYLLAVKDGVTEIKVKDGTTVIADEACAWWNNRSIITKLTLPDGLLTIGKEAFVGLGVTELVIPDSVLYIGRRAFGSCNSLAKITLPFTGSSKENAATVKFSHIFETVPASLKTVVLTGVVDVFSFERCENLTSVTLPEGMLTISDYAFYGCSSLTSVTIPDSVTSIGISVFADCTALATLEFLGTVEEWNDIPKKHNWNYRISAKQVICSNGIVNL